jgi:outer membrane protein assembly factor BamE (lipoprotein component of BamABCDE complex)
MIRLGACLLVLAGVSLSACVDETPRIARGRDFPIERMAAIKKGISTQASVQELLGEPYRKEKMPERRERWQYFVRWEATHAILGIIPGSVDVTEKQLEIVFDGNFVESFQKEINNYSE